MGTKRKAHQMKMNPMDMEEPPTLIPLVRRPYITNPELIRKIAQEIADIEAGRNMEEELLDTASQNSQAPILEIGDQPSREFLELFAKLDSAITGEIIEKAWKLYDTIGQQIVLEGNQNVWMACAFFTSVWQATPIGHQQELICRFSLTKLLELCQVSVLDFFDKLNKWADMILASRRLLDFINRVQSNLAVTAVIFKKFLPIFRHIFVDVPAPPATRQSPHKTRYSAAMMQKLSSGAVLELTWLFYIAMKIQLPPNQQDLMNSYHLLLCVIDYVYTGLEQAGMQKHLSKGFANSLLVNQQTPLEHLCEKFEAIMLDAKHLRAHWMLPRIRLLSAEGALGDLEGGAIFVNFDHSQQAFDELYEQRMMVRAEVDERLFLRTALANMDTVFSGKLDESAVSILRQYGENGQLTDTELLMKITTQGCLEKLGAQKQSQLQPPIAGKSYVITPEAVCPNIAISAEMKSAEKIDQFLTEYKQRDEQEILDYIFEECHQSPREHIAEQLRSFTRKFMAAVDEEMSAKGPDYDADFEANVGTHIPKMETLFYYFLQKIITYDRERALNMGLEMNIDMGAIFQSNDFLSSVYICACDLILWAHGSERQFPWALEMFRDDGVAPINFYRIFELIVRAETELTKEMVKHLNRAEECVLEELAWAPHSPIWTTLKQSRAVEQFGEISPVPGSQILARTYVSTHRHADLSQSNIMFFRKVYHLATIRLTDLCERVRIMDDLTRQKIWTLFEHIFRMQFTMLKGRHLDQLLMCCIYIITKVCNLGITFQDILYHYRHQPQASIRVYRQVLMENPFDPTQPADQQANGIGGDMPPVERDDLIKFYNRIFVSRVEDFVKLLHPSGQDSKENLVPLSPMPKVPLNPLSPRKLISERINVVPMSQYAQSISQSKFPGLPIRRYDFHKSPSKDLRSINAMIRGGGGNPTNGSGPASSHHYFQSTSGPIY